jgi:hypothetical protein
MLTFIEDNGNLGRNGGNVFVSMSALDEAQDVMRGTPAPNKVMISFV